MLLPKGNRRRERWGGCGCIATRTTGTLRRARVLTVVASVLLSLVVMFQKEYVKEHSFRQIRRRNNMLKSTLGPVTQELDKSYRHGITNTIHNLTSLRELQNEHNNAQPFPHLQLKGLFDPNLLKKARHEAITQLRAHQKETDLFKVLQVREDLSGIRKSDPELAQKLPNLLALRDILMKPEFVNMLRNVTGCGPLCTERLDCSINVYVKGNHLLCHDDAIGSRRLSYILYLVDEDPKWEVEEGGRLELYTQDDIEPSAWLVPEWNTMAIFKVDPGRTFHAVEEVYGQRPRLSISGWYHEPKTEQQQQQQQRISSRETLKTLEDDVRTWSGLRGCMGCQALSENDLPSALKREDKEFLSKFMNPNFLHDQNVRLIHYQFLNDSSACLSPFLTDAIHPIQSIISSNWTSENEQNWQLVGPPQKRRYLKYVTNKRQVKPTLPVFSKFQVDIPQTHYVGYGNNEQQLGPKLEHILNNFLLSEQFQRYIYTVTGLRTTATRAEIRHFRRGKDYSLAFGGGLPPGRAIVDVTLCLAQGFSSDWETSNLGGSETYIAVNNPEENTDSEDAAICRAPNPEEADVKLEDEPLLTVGADFNLLSIVVRDEGSLRFVKYLEKDAPGDRIDIAVEFKVHDQDVYNPGSSDDYEHYDNSNIQNDDNMNDNTSIMSGKAGMEQAAPPPQGGGADVRGSSRVQEMPELPRKSRIEELADDDGDDAGRNDGQRGIGFS